MPGPTRIVCLGGGYVALHLVRRLRREIRSGQVDLTVVGRDNFHTFHGFVADMLVGRIQPGQIITPARRIFRPARFHNAEIETIDLARRRVITSRVLDGRQYELGYDHLVLAMGMQDDLDRYPGLAEHGLRLRSYADAFNVRNHLLTALELAEIEPDPQERRRLLTFLVVGGNYGGVEVAADLNDYFRLLCRREYPRLDPEEIRVVLVHSGAGLLPELGAHQPRLQRWAQRFLAGSGMEIRLNTRIAAATPTEAILQDGTRIPTHTVISCTGAVPPPALAALDLETDERGRVVVDPTGRVPGRPEVWAGGDCSAFPHPRGGTNPGLAIYAMRAGRQIGVNLRHVLAGRPQAPLTFTGLGDAVALGRRRAAAHLKGIPVRGFPAYLLWRAFLLAYVPTWDRRLRLLFDWTVTPLLGRDVVSMQVAAPAGLRAEVYEQGQDIIREGDVGRRLYVLRSGSAEVIRAGVVVATLAPGDHFGERAVFGNIRRTATVRATSRVEVLALSQDAALSLGDAVPVLGAVLRADPGRPVQMSTNDDDPGEHRAAP